MVGATLVVARLAWQARQHATLVVAWQARQ